MDSGETVGTGTAARAKAYTFVDTYTDAMDSVVGTLQAESGVVTVEKVSNPPTVVMVTEAPTYDELVRWTMRALADVRQYTRSTRFLPVRSGLSTRPSI